MAFVRSDELRAVSARPGIYEEVGKRFFDLAFALLILPIVAPAILILWILARRDGGTGFFGHIRIGRGGTAFKCWKVRTMAADSERLLREHLASNPDAAKEWNRNRKLSDDPRITRVGKFLRRTSLDELPQIWNVLKGEMSFVGPRPIVRTELPLYGRDAEQYLAVRPGITGLWQVSGRNDIDYDERVSLDVQYASNVSLVGDMTIIALTASEVLSKSGK